MELNIYFKNVGQGDTIFLDWRSSPAGRKRFALIDCNIFKNDIEPVTQHIEEHGIKEFDFVLLSHPHSDHFSGFLKFFEYCEVNDIIIQRFLHTCAFDPAMLRATLHEEINEEDFETFVLSGVNFEGHRETLYKLYCRVVHQAEKNGGGFIKYLQAVNNMPFTMSSGIQGQFLAPGLSEIQEYIRGNYAFDANPRVNLQQDTENNPHANILSSFFRVFSEEEEWQVLLSSDCTKDTLRQILNNAQLRFTVHSSKLLAMQVPHHGSEHNHVKEFWHDMKDRKQTHVVVSVGLGYGHPARSVIEYFKENYHCVQATNFVGGYQEVFSEAPTSLHRISYLSALDLSAIGAGSAPKCDIVPTTGPTCSEKHLRVVIEDGDVRCTLIPSEDV